MILMKEYFGHQLSHVTPNSGLLIPELKSYDINERKYDRLSRI